MIGPPAGAVPGGAAPAGAGTGSAVAGIGAGGGGGPRWRDDDALDRAFPAAPARIEVEPAGLAEPARLGRPAVRAGLGLRRLLRRRLLRRRFLRRRLLGR